MPYRPKGAGPRTSGSSESRAGYTLIETLAVLTLLGIMLAIAGPRLDISGSRTDSAMHALGNVLLAAQKGAVTRQHPVTVSFDLARGALRVHYDRNADGAVGTGETVRVQPLPQGVTFGQGSAPSAPIGAGPVTFRGRRDNLPMVTFQRNGSASEEGGFYITSRRDARGGGHPGHARVVSVERATGRATWSTYTRQGWKRSF